jgi:hypothetical protein
MLDRSKTARVASFIRWVPMLARRKRGSTLRSRISGIPEA